MSVLAGALHPGFSAPTAAELDDARESLSYWESRAQRLPRHAVRRRREAKEMARRWHERVVAAERDYYGRGILGIALLLACERRLPESARRTGRVVARRAAQAAALLGVMIVALVVAGAWAAVEMIATVLRALG